MENATAMIASQIERACHVAGLWPQVVVLQIVFDMSAIGRTNTPGKASGSVLLHVGPRLVDANWSNNVPFKQNSTPEFNETMEKNTMDVMIDGFNSSKSSNLQPRPKYCNAPRMSNSTGELFFPFFL